MIEPAVSILVPVAGSHDESLHGRHRVTALALQYPVEPAEMKLVMEVLDGGVGTEFDIARITQCIRSVCPRSHNQVDVGIQASAQFVVILNGASGIGVIPAGNQQHRDVSSLVVILDPVNIQVLPVVVIVTMGHHFENIVFEIR